METTKDKYEVRQLLGKIVVTKSGKTLGKISDLIFEVRTGELLHLVLGGATKYAETIDLEIHKDGRQLVPYSSVISVGDFIVVNEEDLI